MQAGVCSGLQGVPRTKDDLLHAISLCIHPKKEANLCFCNSAGHRMKGWKGRTERKLEVLARCNDPSPWDIISTPFPICSSALADAVFEGVEDGAAKTVARRQRKTKKC